MNKTFFVITGLIGIGFIIITVLFLTFSSPYNLSPLSQEIKKYQKIHGDGGGLDFTPILQNYFKIGMTPVEVVGFFKDTEFVINKSRKDTWNDGKEYDEMYGAYFSRPILPPFIYQIYRLEFYFKDGKLVKFRGRVVNEST